jgi:hypothetical protein
MDSVGVGSGLDRLQRFALFLRCKTGNDGG